MGKAIMMGKGKEKMRKRKDYEMATNKKIMIKIVRERKNKFNVYGRCQTVSMVNMVKKIKGV